MGLALKNYWEEFIGFIEALLGENLSFTAIQDLCGHNSFIVVKLSTKLLLNDQSLLSPQQSLIPVHPNPGGNHHSEHRSTPGMRQAFSQCG